MGDVSATARTEPQAGIEDGLVALARERAQYYAMCSGHYDGCEHDHLGCLLEQLAERIARLEHGRADLIRLIHADSAELRQLCAARNYAERERDAARREIKALKAKLEHERKLLGRALDDLMARAADKVRLDWLADPENQIGRVQLPTAFVEQNVHSLRAAIDAAMAVAK